MLFAIALLTVSAAAELLPSCSVFDFGAKGDNTTEDTAAVAAAISACSTVRFPAPHTFLLRPVKLDAHDNLTLFIEPGATLTAWRDPNTYNHTQSISALLWSDGKRPCGGGQCALPLDHFTLTGGGTIDGQGWRWWPFMKTRPRPILLNVYHGTHLRVSNITMLDSPAFHIQVRGSDMEIDHVTIRAGGCHGWATAPNTDGINIGGQRIWVHDCFVHNGDDCVPTNTGWNNSDTDGVLVERVECECGTNGGVPIIAGAANIKNVLYRDMKVSFSNQGAGAKISEAYDTPSGVFSNITWRNISVINPRYAAIYTNLFVEDSGGGGGARTCRVPVNASRPAKWLTAANFTFDGVRATINSTAGAYAGCFVCSPTRPCTGFSFEGVAVEDLAPAPVPLPPYVCENVGFTAEGSSPTPCAA